MLHRRQYTLVIDPGGFGDQAPEKVERYDQPVLVRLNTRDELELRTGFPQTPEDLYGYQAVILDDIGYVQQSREEMEVLFTLLAERYERRSVMITTNLVFSRWEQIFKDPMTTAAAVDRLVHHSVILELNLKRSYRAEKALESQGIDAEEGRDK